jgi:hypothetical protein
MEFHCADHPVWENQTHYQMMELMIHYIARSTLMSHLVCVLRNGIRMSLTVTGNVFNNRPIFCNAISIKFY